MSIGDRPGGAPSDAARSVSANPLDIVFGPRSGDYEYLLDLGWDEHEAAVAAGLADPPTDAPDNVVPVDFTRGRRW